MRSQVYNLLRKMFWSFVLLIPVIDGLFMVEHIIHRKQRQNIFDRSIIARVGLAMGFRNQAREKVFGDVALFGVESCVMERSAFSWFLILCVSSALGVMTACVKEIPLPAEERDAVATAVNNSSRGTMDIMTIEQVSVARTPTFLRVALKVIPDKVPQSKSALRAHIHGTSMDVIRQVALNSSMEGFGAITVEYYASLFGEPAQEQGPERVRLFYSTNVRTVSLKGQDVSTMNDGDIAALVTHTRDEIRKLDLPN